MGMTKEQRREYHKNYMNHRYHNDPEFREKFLASCNKYKKKHPERWKKNNPRMVRNYKLLYKFGITLEEYEAMVEAQNGLCYVCKLPPKEGKGLGVDHSHKTGKVRALLCASCNFWVGLAEVESPKIVRLREYIREFEEKHARESMVS